MLRNIGSNWVLNAVRIAVLMHLTPYVIRALGADVNGVWVSIVAMTGFLKLLILGVPMASVRYIAEHVARKDLSRANQAVSTCLGMCLIMGSAAALVGGGLYFAFDSLLLENPLWQELAPETMEAARLAFLMIVAQVAVGFAMRLPYGIFDAHHDFVTRNMIMGLELLLRYALTLILLAIDASLVLLALVQIVCMLSEFAVALAVIRRRFPGIRFGLSAFDPGLVRGVLGFSIFAMLLNVGSMLAFRADAMVIGSYLSSLEVTWFDVGNKFFEPLTEVVIGVGMVVMPMATRLQAEGRREELEVIFLRWSKICFSIVLLIGLYLLVLGPEFLEWWLQEDFHPSSGPVLQVLMLSFLVYLPVRGVALPILMGLGKPGRPALALLLMGVINLGISIALVRSQGIFGVALGTAIPNVLFAAAVMVLACRELGVSPATYLGYVWGRALVGLLAPLGFLLLAKYALAVSGFLELFATGVAMVLIFGAVWILFVYRGDPHLDLDGRLRGKLSALRKGRDT